MEIAFWILFGPAVLFGCWFLFSLVFALPVFAYQGAAALIRHLGLRLKALTGYIAARVCALRKPPR